VSEPVYTGKHVGGFLGIAASHKPVRFRFVVFVTFRDGKFSGERFYYDLASLLRQIGVNELPGFVK
jgi:predicted ester cyclase